MNYPDYIWQLMARVLHQEADAEECTVFAKMMEQDPALQQQYELTKRLWQAPKNIQGDESDAQATVKKIIFKANVEEHEHTQEIQIFDLKNSKRRRRRILFTVAACILSVLSFGTVWLMLQSSAAPQAPLSISTKETLVAQKGSRTRSMLPDGTTVWLNAGSRLHYINDFSGATREVKLEGEAYFDVAHKKNQPFIVHTDGINIKVLGTSFNVKAYPEDKNVETTLFQGRVQVFREEADDVMGEQPLVDMRPNQKLVLSKRITRELEKNPTQKAILPQNGIPAFELSTIDSTKREDERFETAWLYSRLEFRGDNFEELALKLARWYNINIVFEDAKVKQLTFNGSFEKESIAEAFTALQTAVPNFNYKIVNNDISVSSLR